MPQQLTYQRLNQLLINLGFTRGDVIEKHVIWKHPQSGCILRLPENKAGETPRPADLVGIKAQLAMQGHLDEEAFDIFIAEGKLPARSGLQQ